MTSWLSDQAVAERVLQHIRAGTTDVGDTVWREPVENYRSAARFSAEIEHVLRRVPTPFCPSAALPDAGSYVARAAAGVPLLVVRGEDGRVRAFRNACRHRGTALANGAGCAKAFVCPYHGWTYRLDGRLQHVPHSDGFPGLDQQRHGLSEVAAAERQGLVFVTQDGAVPEAAFADDLPELLAPDQVVLSCAEVEFDVNWKIYLESFLEGYHIRTAHPRSFYRFGFDNLNVVECHGRHSRVTFPFRRIEKLTDVPPPQRRVDGLLTYVYHLFPNALVTVLSHHTNLVVLDPLGPSRTRLITYMLTNRDGGPQAAEAATRDANFVNNTGAAEDLALVVAIQRGLASGANDVLTFGAFESAIAHLHRTLQQVLAEVPPGPSPD